MLYQILDTMLLDYAHVSYSPKVLLASLFYLIMGQTMGYFDLPAIVDVFTRHAPISTSMFGAFDET